MTVSIYLHLLLEQFLHLRNHSLGFGETRSDGTFKQWRGSKESEHSSLFPSRS